MEAYPDDYIAHNLPLILVSGLANNDNNDDQLQSEYPLLEQTGTLVESDFPLLDSSPANDLRDAFLDYDAYGARWRASADAGRSNSIASRIKMTGRVSEAISIV